MDCSTIILNFNTPDLTIDAVHSALRGAAALEHEVIVVENGSTDDSLERLQGAFPPRAYPNVKLIACDTNHGFSKGNNIGAEASGGEVLFFFNSDAVAHGNAIEYLYHFVQENRNVGIAGPLVLNLDGTEQPSTSSMLTPFRILRHNIPLWSLLKGKDRRRDYVPPCTEPVDFMSGCAMAIRREVFDKIGRWDETYFMYAEDRELCYAAKHAGFENYFVREASITHHGGASSWHVYHKQQVVACRSAVVFLRRHHGSAMVAIYRVTGAIGFGLRTIIFRLWEATRPKRAEEYKRRRMAAKELLRWFVFDFD